jgi:hypothetical protein
MAILRNGIFAKSNQEIKMNLFKYDPECYRCKNEGWVINSLGTYINCPVCHDSKIIRILKENIFKLIVKLFKLSSDYLKKLNWASEKTIHFQRLYNVELSGHVEERQELPFENYSEAFEKGNSVFKNKLSYKILSEYVYGYTVQKELVGLALETLTGSQDLLPMAENTHNNALLGRDTSEIFYTNLNSNLRD